MMFIDIGPESESRPLHLHTLDSLIADLVSGRQVETGPEKSFKLPDEPTRSALEWYRKKGAANWTASVGAQHAEDLVNRILQAPPELAALPARPANANSRRLRIAKLEAHRFAGLHKFGTPSTPPPTYVHNFSSSLTLFEGRNGSGKTSLLNAIIWTLTGELLRPQREPEAAEDFECKVSARDDKIDDTVHKLSPLTPMPHVDQYRPDQAWIPADTWVELTFADENGVELPIIRRSQTRSPQGKLKETPPELSILGVDPVALRIGTIMPGLLPLIRVGSESELGRAVSQLTGLSALVDLADHVRRAKQKIDKEFVKAKVSERDRIDDDYNVARNGLDKLINSHTGLKIDQIIPSPSDAPTIESTIDQITDYFQFCKVSAYESTRDILGERFDPSDVALLTDLEKNIGRALERVSQPQVLPSAARLHSLRQISADLLDTTENKIKNILTEAAVLNELAKEPTVAARKRLYARIAAWIADHPDPQRNEDMCIVCGNSLGDVRDIVTGQFIKTHIHEAKSGASLLSQTLGRWADNALGDLMRTVPEALRAELSTDLPEHPRDLLRLAIIGELFEFDPFKGALQDLKPQTAKVFDDAVNNCSDLSNPLIVVLPNDCAKLSQALHRLDRAIRFARWRQSNDVLAREIVTGVLGRATQEGAPAEALTLTGKLSSIEATVKAAKPLSDALTFCESLKKCLKARRAVEKRLADYGVASSALASLSGLGQLADDQVESLRKTLREDAALWRSRIYLGAYPDTAHELVDTGMGRKGEIDLLVQTGGVSAPAQHVTNASALRASLAAFFFSFWEHVLKERGGLTTLILDDPQELFDDENRERLASALIPLVNSGAQLVVTSYDKRFSARVSRLAISGGIEHLEVSPATRQQPVIRTTLPLPAIIQRKLKHEADRNAEEPAREFADACRVFFESKLGTMFDDPAHSAWSISNPNPTLATFVQRLRPLVKSSPQGMFSAQFFRHFVDHPALRDESPVLLLMNKAHHGRRDEIRPADVAQCAEDLSDLINLIEQMYDECYRWRRRDAPKPQPAVDVPAPLECKIYSPLAVAVCPDLAAFTHHGFSGASQETVEY